MAALVWIGIFFAYFIIEFIISFFFTYKISFVSKEKYNWAAISGATSTFLFMFSILLASYFSNNTTFIKDWFFNNSILFLFWTTLSTTLGNFFSTLLIPHLKKIFQKNNKLAKEKEE